jgi:hypothetical protein
MINDNLGMRTEVIKFRYSTLLQPINVRSVYIFTLSFNIKFYIALFLHFRICHIKPPV